MAWCISDRKHEFRDTATGKRIVRLESIDVQNVGLYAISPDQKKFAIVARLKSDSGENGVEVFDIATQDRLAFIPMVKNSYYDIEFAGDSNRVLVATWDTIEILDTAKNQQVGRLTLGWKPEDKKKKLSLIHI